MADLFAEIPSEDIEGFKQDFIPLIKISSFLDKEISEGHEKAYSALPKFRKYLDEFNRKYKGVFIKFVETNEGFQLRLYIMEEKSVKDVFFNSASKIPGLSAIGSDSLERDSIHNQKEFELELRQITDRIYIRYYGDASVFLKFDKNQQMVELVHHAESIVRENHPEFVLFAYYSLKNYDSRISLKSIAGSFSSLASGEGFYPE